MSIRPMKKSLRTFSTDLHSEFLDEEAAVPDASKQSIIDFNSAGLYIGGLQTVAAVVVAACVSILSCWLLPISIVSGVRTLVATSILSFLVVYKAIRIGKVRGVSMLFAALRPCVFIYLLALTVEELGHGTCKGDEEDVHSTARRIVYHVATVVMLVAAFMRAHSPRNESDLSFCMTIICLSVIAVLPMPSSSSHGPLSQSPRTLIDAGERILRAVLFSFTYSMHVYASAPTRNVGSELIVCVGRAAAASVWILSVSPILLIAFPFQSTLCILMSISASKAHEYETVPLNSVESSNERNDARESHVKSEYESVSNSDYDITNQHLRGISKVNARLEDSETEEASLSCSSDIESELSTRRYGAFSSIASGPYNTSTGIHQPPSLSFTFSSSSLQPLTQIPNTVVQNTPQSNGPSPETIAAAIARESHT